MKKISSFVFLFLISSLVFSQSLDKADRDSILKVLEKQRIGWNNGDIEEYMKGYWKSDSLRFIGKSGINYGWEATLKSYKKGYPDKETMGKLTFEIISLESVGKNTAFMIGKWSLKREKNDIAGYFSLLWKKINGIWLITTDHSS